MAAAIEASAALRRSRVLDRIAAGKKHCPRCDRLLPAGDFRPNPSAADGRRGYCQPCANAYARDRYAAARAQDAQVTAALRNWRPPPDPPCCTGTWDGTWQHDTACPWRPR
jgi:hypothetical protein